MNLDELESQARELVDAVKRYPDLTPNHVACPPKTFLALVSVAKAAETDRRIGTQETYDAVGDALSKLTEALK